MAQPFESEEELDALMARVKACKVPNEEFSHRNHLAMAACTVFGGGTLEDIRATILALNEANGVEQTQTGGYHETLTVAWHALVKAHLASQHEGTGRLAAVNSVLCALDDKRIILRHYSRDLIMSWDARTQFVEPDLEPLPR
ncbi:MAG TPA: hypothetical protein VNI20_04200 [Fimbriimonadaceae bacterium]|nr:hypothetical protein [Fimbriimonadaceae bacterium]